jgi:hypothetical protein
MPAKPPKGKEIVEPSKKGAKPGEKATPQAGVTPSAPGGPTLGRLGRMGRMSGK